MCVVSGRKLLRRYIKSKLKIRHHFSSAKQVNRSLKTKTGRKFQKFKAKSQQKYFQHTHALVQQDPINSTEM